VGGEQADEGLLCTHAAAEHGLDPDHQLSWAERLDQMIVGAQFKPEHAMVLRGLGGQHGDRHVRASPYLSTHLLAGQVREHQVEHDELRLGTLRKRQPVAAVLGHCNLEALRSK
jgi:hypothetical protein